MNPPGNWDWQSPLRNVASGGYNVGDVVNGWRWTGESWESQGGGGGDGGSVPSFNFDWAAARKAAFDPEHPEASVLGRYYLQKLKDAEFDTTRAKRLIEEDYTRGVRISQEDYTRETRTAEEDYGASTAEEKIKAGEERRSTLGGANQRGVLFDEIPRGEATSQAPYSQYAKGFLLEPMEEGQRLRSLAIERALQRQKELLSVTKERGIEGEGITRTRGIETEAIQAPRTKQALEEETRTKAYATPGMGAQQQHTENYLKFNASQGR